MYSNGLVLTETDMCYSDGLVLTETSMCYSDGLVLTEMDMCYSDGLVLTETDVCYSDGLVLTETDMCYSDGLVLTETDNDMCYSDGLVLTEMDMCYSDGLVLTETSMCYSDGLVLTEMDMCYSDGLVLTETDVCYSNGLVLTETDMCYSDGLVLTETDMCYSDGLVLTETDMCYSDGLVLTETDLCYSDSLVLTETYMGYSDDPTHDSLASHSAVQEMWHCPWSQRCSHPGTDGASALWNVSPCHDSNQDKQTLYGSLATALTAVAAHLDDVVFAAEGGRQPVHGAPVGGLLAGHRHPAGAHLQVGCTGRRRRRRHLGPQQLRPHHAAREVAELQLLKPQQWARAAHPDHVRGARLKHAQRPEADGVAVGTGFRSTCKIRTKRSRRGFGYHEVASPIGNITNHTDFLFPPFIACLSTLRYPKHRTN